MQRLIVIGLFVVGFVVFGFQPPVFSQETQLPDAWLKEWNNPSPELRPLQIVHGYYNEDVAYYRDLCGLGGVVCNFGPKGYLRDEAEWKRFVDFVRRAREAGLRIWIYDEDGYPSPMAGGIVLDGHPELESMALVYDPTQKDSFAVRPAYEFTHASNNYAAARRYPNPLHPVATQRFLEVTHDAYRKHLGDELFGQVEAFFTDEPSLNAVNIGQIPEESRKNVRVDDPLDPNLKPLPMVPWCDDLPELYRERYDEDLMSQRKSLFTGSSEQDKKVRKQFWSLIAELNADRFYGAIEKWCHDAGASWPTFDKINAPLKLASSGHSLHEELLLGHVPLDGNKLTILSRMDVPGLDELNSDPRCCFWGGWKAAAFPCSAAILGNKRLVMTEISDFSQIMSGEKPASLSMMEAACAWQAAWGVTEFTLYYGIREREGNRLDTVNGDVHEFLRNRNIADGPLAERTHKAFCGFIGRMNSILREAIPVRPVLLYYPIDDLQEEYLPMAEPLRLEGQTPKMKSIIESFDRLGQLLTGNQIPFVLADDRLLETVVGDSAYHTLLIPRETKLSASTEKLLEQFTARGGKVLKDQKSQPIDAATLKHEIVTNHSMPNIQPTNDFVTLGSFTRENRRIHLLVNGNDKEYSGVFHLPQGTWTILDPSTGKITQSSSENALPLKLTPHQTLLFMESL